MNSLKEQKWFSGVEIHVIVGRFNANKDALEKEWNNSPNVHLHYNIPNIADYMKKCDIAVSAGGVTTYELCACGIPTIMYTLADNQLEIAQTVSEKELIFYAGDVREHIDCCVDNIISRIDELRSNVVLRQEISVKMLQTVDGHGCERLVDKVNSLRCL